MLLVDTFPVLKSAFSCSIEQPRSLAEALPQGAARTVPDAHVVGQVEPSQESAPRFLRLFLVQNQHGVSHITAEAARPHLTGTFPGHAAELWLVVLATHPTDSVPGEAP